MPDVNTLVAAAWPNHVHHHLAMNWLRNTFGSSSWATCATVQAGFVRISMNPHVVGDTVTARTALDLLSRYTADDLHEYWAETPPLQDWPDYLIDRVQGHRQVSDAMLLAGVIRNGATLVTLDQRIFNLLPESRRDHVRLLVPEV